MKVTLPILHHTDSSHLLSELGIENSGEFVPKPIIFYNINAIKTYDDDVNQTTVFANDTTFVCDLPLNKVEALIDDARLK